MAGAACASIGSKISGSRVAVTTSSIPLAGSFAVLAYWSMRPLYRSSAAELRNAGLELRKTTARDSLIVAADNGNPTVFYYAERWGWHFPKTNGIYDGNPSTSHGIIVDLEQLRRCSATHLVLPRTHFGGLSNTKSSRNMST